MAVKPHCICSNTAIPSLYSKCSTQYRSDRKKTHRARDLDIMKKADVNIQTLARVQKVTAEGVEYMDKNGQTILAQVDLVVVSTGQRTAGDDLAEGLEADAITVKRAGDAVAMGNIRVNVRSGFHAGYDA